MSLSNVDVTAAIIIIAAVWFVVQSVKATKLPNKYLPLVSVIVGIIIAMGYSFLNVKDIQLEQDLFFGIFAGFSASGLDDTLSDSVSGLINNFVSGLVSKIEGGSDSSSASSNQSASSDSNQPAAK